MNEPITPTDAEVALGTARAAHGAARVPRPLPPWLPPTAGLLFAGGFVNLALLDRHPQTWAYLAAALGCLVAFLVLAVTASRSGGVTPWPSGPVRARVTRQLVSLVPLAAGGAAAVAYGFAGFLVVVGVGLGALTWARLAYPHRETPQ